MPTRTESWQLTDRVRVSGGEVATGVFGDGPPVVLVHGTPASSYLWRGVVPSLARQHTVHVWDMLGFGCSHPDPGYRRRSPSRPAPWPNSSNTGTWRRRAWSATTSAAAW